MQERNYVNEKANLMEMKEEERLTCLIADCKEESKQKTTWYLNTSKAIL